MLLLLVQLLPVLGQGKGDTLLLTEQQFLDIVRQYHPVAKQAQLLTEQAKADLLVARGGFDPLLYSDAARKTFDGKLYYSYFNPELKIPTWYGIEIKAGLEDVRGINTDPQQTFGQSSYLGISVPLAKNLLMDKRRAALQQAKIFVSQSRAEQELVLNDLLFDAVVTYWNWADAWRQYELMRQVVQVNEDRMRFVVSDFEQGNRAAIDTTEVLAQLQSFRLQQQETIVNLRNRSLELSNFLWRANVTPYDLPEAVRPDITWLNIDPLAAPSLDSMLVASGRHPKLRVLGFKADILETERRLKFQDLLPTLNLQGNLLNRGYSVLKDGSAAFYSNNNKLGVQFGLPLRFSEGRGAYRKAKLKLQDVAFETDLRTREVENKTRIYYNELEGLQKQVRIYTEAYDSYYKLFRAEDLRFKIGESSLFLLNQRENKALEALQKLTELRAKLYKTRGALQWAAGQLR
jgi:outer membrane protein TolC